ncbi:glycosyltransferase family 1 protein, partial [Streptomyces pseudogriseolus]
SDVYPSQVLARFTWARAAQGTVARYREAMARAGAGRDTGAAARTGVRAATGAVGPSAPAAPAASDTPTDPAAAVSVPAADTSDRESRATC